MLHFATLELPLDLNNYINEDGKLLKSLEGLNVLNFFVGGNNSGKSRLLRTLLNQENIRFLPLGWDTDRLRDSYEELKSKMEAIIKEHAGIIKFNVEGVSELSLEQLDLSRYFQGFFPQIKTSENWSEMLRVLSVLEKSHFSPTSWKGQTYPAKFTKEVHDLLREYSKEIEFFKTFKLKEPVFRRCYIPILRSLNCFEEYTQGHSTKDFLEHRIRKNYFGGDEITRVEVFTGQQMRKIVQDMLLGGPAERKRIAEFEKFLSHHLFSNATVSLIPRVGDDVLYIKIGEPEYPIHQLGDGIQNLIILSFPIFAFEDSVFVIDEPELNLHPAMQRKLIRVMQNHTNHQYFVTTHSNHILDISADYSNVSIFTLGSSTNHPDEKMIKLVKDGDNEILAVLGVQNTSVFLSNSTIWVEGITDRLYIRKYIELYLKANPDKELIDEDIDYSFVEYGGGNITHWSFLEEKTPTINVKRLCGDMILVADKDDESKKRERKDLLRKNLKDRYIELDCREIENSLPLSTILSVVQHYENNDSLVAPNFRNIYPHQNTKIGTFIESKLLRGVFTRTGGYKEDSGTIKEKVRFCQLAIESLNSFKELPEPTKLIVENLYNFVISKKQK